MLAALILALIAATIFAWPALTRWSERLTDRHVEAVLTRPTCSSRKSGRVRL